MIIMPFFKWAENRIRVHFLGEGFQSGALFLAICYILEQKPVSKNLYFAEFWS
jgi:hypothetical protein